MTQILAECHKVPDKLLNLPALFLLVCGMKGQLLIDQVNPKTFLTIVVFINGLKPCQVYPN